MTSSETEKLGLPADKAGQVTRSAQRRSWWRRPWVIPLAAVALIFIVNAVPRYLTFDPARSRIPSPPGFPEHYPLLVAHVLFGSVALLSCCMQIWSGLRRRYPAVHRTFGRIYVFGGALPAGVFAMAVGVISPSGPALRLNSVVQGSLWMTCTIAGFRAGRQRRYADHRRWMVRSVTLTMSIILARVFINAFKATVLPPPHAGGAAALTSWFQTVSGMASWSSWVIPMLLVEWWLVERGSAARRRAARTGPTTS